MPADKTQAMMKAKYALAQKPGSGVELTVINTQRVDKWWI